MNAFAWRRRTTRHFGEQWVPFAEINLQSASGRWHAFSVQVDTGAVISVVPRSAAELLGVDPEKGESIDLAGVGAPPRHYVIHRFNARIGDMPQFEMRVAVADCEDVPSLLGRLDVLDRFQIDLDVSLEKTRISPSWLEEDDRLAWRHCMSAEATILRGFSNHPLPGRADEAATRFINRADQLVDAGAGLLKLHLDFELPLIVRSLFELSVQFEYLMRDPEPRAELYLEYEHITKHRTMEAWVDMPGPIGDHLRASPRRAEGEKQNRAEYDRVCDQYSVKPNSTKARMHWYAGSLRDLANELGRTAEYAAVYGLYSAWAHGDPWTAGLLKIGDGGLWHLLAYWSRILIQVADTKRIILAGEEYEGLAELAKGMTTK